MKLAKVMISKDAKNGSKAEIIVRGSEVSIFAIPGISTVHRRSRRLYRLLRMGMCVFSFGHYVCHPFDESRFVKELLSELRKFYHLIEVYVS